MLHIITGRAGYGKTEYIKKIALEKALNKEVIIIVPDQIGFATEQYVLNEFPVNVAENVKVFHFTRFSEEIFRIYGGIKEKRLDDKGKSLLMALAIKDCENDLLLYESAAKSGKMLNLMLDITDEFKLSGIIAEEVFGMSKKLDGELAGKLNDIALVYSSFEARLHNSYIEQSDIIIRASQILNTTDYFKDKVLILDGFESFGKEKLSIIEDAMVKCSDVYCTLCCDEIYSDEVAVVFDTQMQTARDLIMLAKENNVAVSNITKLTTAHRFKNEDIHFVEANYFSSSKVDKINTENITIYKAEDIYNEAEFVGATIRELAMQGHSYGDISIICRNTSAYSDLLENTLKKYEVPCYISKPRRMDSSPLIWLLLTVFNIAEFGFKTEYVLKVAKSGLCGLNTKEISELENYVYLWKIDGAMWKNEFTKSPNGFSSKSDDARLAMIESYRKRIVNPIARLISNCKDKTGKDICKNIFMMLQKYNCEEHILENVKSFNELGLFEKAAEQTKIWDELMGVLDLFYHILEDVNISLVDYANLMRDIITKQEVMDIPLKLDTVILGSAENIKQEAKIVFLIGCTKDEFPLLPSSEDIFTDFERKCIIENKIELIKNHEKDILLERFYAYNAVASASEKLYVSYPSTSDGKTLYKSEIIARIEDLLNIKNTEDVDELYFANSAETVFTAMAKKYRENNETVNSLKKYIAENDEYSQRYEALKRSVSEKALEIDDKQTAKSLYRLENLSPSQIDVFFSCKFKYFCKYGLNAKEKKTAEINVLEYGTVMHYLLEKVLENRDVYEEYDDVKLSEEVKKLILSYADENMGGYANLSIRDKYRLSRVERTAVRIIVRLLKELRQSKFEPKYLELELNAKSEFKPLEITTENGEKIVVNGKIDRVDIYDSADGKYVRVVDYKTGTKVFKLFDILKGMSLQMLIYLCALSENGLKPSGVLYMPSTITNTSADRTMTEADLAKDRDKKMCMNGLVLQKSEIIEAMESAVAGQYIPVKLQKNGELGGKESLVTQDELQIIFDYVKKLISTMSYELLAGDIAVKPNLDTKDICTYCPYLSVCLNEKREVLNITGNKSKAFEIIRGKGETDEKLD